MSEKLKPCPFCGGKAVDLVMIHKIRCKGCGLEVDNFQLDGEYWNTRHLPEGYALVPIEPTIGMQNAGSCARAENWIEKHNAELRGRPLADGPA